MTDEIVVHRDHSRVAVLELVGEHDAYSARKIEERIGALLGEGRNVIVDLRRTTFVDSTAISKLLVANTAAASLGLGFAVVVSSASGWPVRTMFEITHLGEVMAVEATLAGAIKRVRARGSERRSGRERRSVIDRRQQPTAVPRAERRSARDRRSDADRRTQ